jgi:hypothetical protein
MKTELAVVLPQEIEVLAQSVSDEKRNEVLSVLNHVFNGVSKMREQLDNIAVIDENDKVNMKLANTIRLGVRQVRLDAEKEFDQKRQEVQMAMLSFKTEDALWLKSKQTMQILTKEIEEIAKWKESTKERFDAEQKELTTQQRLLKIQPFNSEITRNDVEQLSDAMFDILLQGTEKAYNEKIEAEAKAERERLAAIEAERVERERIKAENERLQKENEEKEKQILAERLKAQQEADAERKKQADILEAQRKESERIQKEKDAENAKLLDELRAKQEAELKAQQEKEAKELKEKQEAEKASKAPIKQKITVWVNSFSIPEFEQNATADNIKAKFEAFKKWAIEQVETI